MISALSSLSTSCTGWPKSMATGRLDLAYAPPFSPVWDPILVAARQASATVRAAP
jgi:hypothetical protein